MEEKKQNNLQTYKSQLEKKNLVWFYKLKPLDICTYIDLNLVFNFTFDSIVNLINFFKKEKMVLPNEFYDKFKGINNKFFKDYFFINKYGWFPDKEIYLYYFFYVLIFKDDEKESNINYILAKHTMKNLKKIKSNLLIKYPILKQNIKEAFEAHNTSMYTLSVPAFLILCDYTCKYSFGEGFYDKVKKQKKINENLEKNPKYKSFYSNFFTPLTINLPLMWNKYERKEEDKIVINKFGYNRHEILHGENLNYLTELNSLKLISLLNYISQCDDILNSKHEIGEKHGK